MQLAEQNKKNNQTVPFQVKQYEFNHFENKVNMQSFQTDRRMRFRNSKDPIYIAFEYIDNQPLDKIAKDFVQDTIKDTMENIMNFISMFKG